MITPILINFNGETWENPEIATEVFYNCQPSEINYNCFDGNLIRIWLKSEEHFAHIVATVCDDELYEMCSGITEFDTDLIAGWLFTVLFEDVWAPGGEQFCFSEFGEKLSVLSSDDTNFNISPDICVHYDGPSEGWGWSS